MPENWREGYRRAMLDTILRIGTPVKSPTSGMWDYEWEEVAQIRHKMHGCGINYEASGQIEEEKWHQFQGTFHEGEHYAYGVGVQIVADDGDSYHWRYTGNMAEFIKEVMKES